MFLISITKNEISQNFKNIYLEELKVPPFVITIATDGNFSKYFSYNHGFSVIESPFFSTSEDNKIIFSHVSYTSQDRSLIIRRSTISGRPIFYTIDSKGNFFCSTHISLLRTAGVAIEENTTVLPEFYIYRHIMPPNTMYKNIYRLLLGERLRVRFDNGKCIIHPIDYYIPPQENQKIISVSQSVKELYSHLNEIINRLNPAKKEIALLLSGGLDSSIISTIYKKNFCSNNSFSTGYHFESPTLNDEKKYAITAANALGMNHRYYESTSEEFLNGVIESIFYAEEPLHHLQSVLLHLLWKNGIPNEQRIVLCAQGAGSTFGYNEIFYLNEKRKRFLYRLILSNLSLSILKRISTLLNKGGGYIDILEKLHKEYPLNSSKNAMWSWMDFGCWSWVCSYFHVTEDQIVRDRYEWIKNLECMSMYNLWSRYSLYGDEDITLAIWSKIGEGNKKVIYYPFYDFDVLNCAFSIPWNLKLQPPRVLTKELAHMSNLPSFIIDRPKLGFSVNSLEWAKKDGIFEPLVSIASKVFDEREIRKMQTISDSRKVQTFWNMLNYAIWKRLHINNEPLDALIKN
jgi:asparagine synthase (glutamine-hydrolysing)